MRVRLLTIVSLFLLIASLPVHAHVGSPDVYYEGDAGPYRLFVTVRVPQVIPGVAEIQVRSQSGDVHSMQMVLLSLTGPGSTLPPTPDVAQQSKQDPQFFTARLLLCFFWEEGGGDLKRRTSSAESISSVLLRPRSHWKAAPVS